MGAHTFPLNSDCLPAYSTSQDPFPVSRPVPTIGKAQPSGKVQSKGKTGLAPKKLLWVVVMQEDLDESIDDEEWDAIEAAHLDSLATWAQEHGLHELHVEYWTEMSQMKSSLEAIQQMMAQLLQKQQPPGVPLTSQPLATPGPPTPVATSTPVGPRVPPSGTHPQLPLVPPLGPWEGPNPLPLMVEEKVQHWNSSPPAICQHPSGLGGLGL